MFLDWIAQLQLLQPDSQTNILGPLPLAIRRALISEITTYLHPRDGKHLPDPAIFASPAHVKWFMEVIGQGFSLPLEDMDIAKRDVQIYSQWLFEPDKRPAAVVKEALEQEFYQIIFHQYSLLFQPRIPSQPTAQHSTPRYQSPPSAGSHRPNSFQLNVVNAHLNSAPISIPMSHPNTPNTIKETLSQLVQRHIELCKYTLDVLATAGRTLELSPESWTVLLKVILGISDSLLKDPIGESPIAGVKNMGDELCDHLLKVLFEMWLRSKVNEVEMWDILKECFIRWTHRPKVIQQWSATALSLTSRVVNLLYGSTEGTDVVILSKGSGVKLGQLDDIVDYAWHRILYLIPPPLQLRSSNFTLAMRGISKIVDAFLAVGTAETMSASVARRPASPDGNTLLHMFGTFLFDACSTVTQAEGDSQKGCAVAFGALCKIFSRPQRRQPFLRMYVERFYAAVSIGLKSDACLPTILLNTTELFATNLEGVRMLAADFITAIKLILPKLRIEFNSSVSIDELRLAAIKVIGTIMCLPNHFDKVELKHGWDWDMQCVSENTSSLGEEEQLVTQLIRVLYADHLNQDQTERPFTSLKFYILELLLMSLRTETSSYNMRYLLHLINVYVIEDVPFCPGLVGTVVKLIQDKILTMQLPSDVTLVAFDVLMDFVDLYDYVKRDSKNVARELVLSLSRYVDTLIDAGKLIQSYPLIVQAYDCMMKWILASQWIVDDRDCYQAVIATLTKGITIFERETDVSGGGGSAAESNSEKKKRRDTTFPPTKQLFQLPPRANRAAAPIPPSGEQGQGTHSPAQRSGSHHHKKEEVAVRMAAEYCMSQFVNQLGKFPSRNDQFLVSRRPTFLDDLHRIKLHRSKQTRTQEGDDTQSCLIRYFLIDKRMILAVFDSDEISTDPARPKNTPAVVGVLRDTTGKYTWVVETQYKDPRANESSPRLEQDTRMGQPKSDIQSDSTMHGAYIPTSVAVNHHAIPSIDNLFERDTPSWQEWNAVNALAERQQLAELEALHANPPKLLQSFPAEPPRANIDLESSRGFRLLLSEIGFLAPSNRKRVTPLRITDTVVSELETLDMLNERDCVSISAYYAQSGNSTWAELTQSPPPLSQQFLQFLNCLGWPIELADHEGFKGKLDPKVCKTAPYYADRTIEFLVNVPYFLDQPESGPDMSPGATCRSMEQIHEHATSEDHVAVIWIEDLDNYQQLANRIKLSSSANAKAMVYIFINPLQANAVGLYWIRILVPPVGNHATSVVASQRLSDNALIFGPLVDGMVVSRHALGAMVRNTAVSAHQACRVVTDTYTRPYVVRKQFIEEMAHRHRSNLSLSDFYTEIFAEKDE